MTSWYNQPWNEGKHCEIDDASEDTPSILRRQRRIDRFHHMLQINEKFKEEIVRVKVTSVYLRYHASGKSKADDASVVMMPSLGAQT